MDTPSQFQGIPLPTLLGFAGSPAELQRKRHACRNACAYTARVRNITVEDSRLTLRLLILNLEKGPRTEVFEFEETWSDIYIEWDGRLILERACGRFLFILKKERSGNGAYICTPQTPTQSDSIPGLRVVETPEHMEFV